MGTVGGEPKKIITNISVTMSHDFVNIMAILHGDAKAGRFSTKGDAVHKRDEIIHAEHRFLSGPPTTPEGEVQAETAASQGTGGTDVD